MLAPARAKVRGLYHESGCHLLQRDVLIWTIIKVLEELPEFMRATHTWRKCPCSAIMLASGMTCITFASNLCETESHHEKAKAMNAMCYWCRCARKVSRTQLEPKIAQRSTLSEMEIKPLCDFAVRMPTGCCAFVLPLGL